VDWQIVTAIGTWFSGIALAFFAFLTWKLLRKQQQLSYAPKLIGYKRYSRPKVGDRIISGELNGNHVDYNGICWEVIISNPGLIQIHISDTIVRVKNNTISKEALIWPGQYCRVFNTSRNNLNEALTSVVISSGESFIRNIVVYDSKFQEILDTIDYKVGGKISIEKEISWEAGGVKDKTV
jgi:hypothetical protein